MRSSCGTSITVTRVIIEANVAEFERPAGLKEPLREYRLLVIRSYLSQDAASALLATAHSELGRRVIASSDDPTEWSEHAIDPSGPLYSALSSAAIRELVASALGRPIAQEQAWLNVYQAGERAGWHRDGQGDLQLVLCLQRPTGGGQLNVELNKKVNLIDLQAGDFVLFDATRIRHATTAVATESPPRITAVCRFYGAQACFEARTS